jgi:signal transduction histidine kinase
MPPHLASEEETRQAGILYVILWVLLTAALISAFFGYLLDFTITATTLCIGSLAILLSLWLVRRGYLNLAGLITLASLLVAMTYLAFVGQGIFDRALLVFPIIIIIASLVLTQSLFVLVTLLCVAAAGLLVWAELNGRMVTSFSERVSLFDFVAVAFILVVTAVFTRLTANRLQQSLARARENERALAEINQQLEVQNQAIQQREEALRRSELEARAFQEKLQALHEVSIALAGTETLESLYRQAIELGRNRLGFDRLGLLLYDEETQMIVGTFGTDDGGRLRDERYFKEKIVNQEIMGILESNQRLGFWEQAILRDNGAPVGKGWNAMSGLWNGTKGIGWLATDNLIRCEPPSPVQLEILVLYGRILGHLVTLKRNEAAIQAYAVELERSNRELQQFAYVSSHDLQEPLRKIQAFGDRLQERYAAALDERGLDYLRRMQEAAARMQTLIQDVLAFSRVDTQKRPFTQVDLSRVLGDVLSDLEMRIEETKAQVSLQSLPCLEADATQMRQLFQNLLSNALKFHHPDVPPVVHIRCEQIVDELAEQRFCRIIVEDNGIGFEEKYSERIFGVFQRLHGRSQYEGTGVGLAVCRRIVERHHGRITATSTPGQGSTFTILLPVQQRDG